MQKIKLFLYTVKVNIIYTYFLVAMIDSSWATQLLAQWGRGDSYLFPYQKISDMYSTRQTIEKPATAPL